MNIEDFIPQGEQKMRIVQELVPGLRGQRGIDFP